MRQPLLIRRRRPRLRTQPNALTWLAFAAMALLMLMPTGGRLLAAATGGTHGMHMAMAGDMPAAMAMHGDRGHAPGQAAAGDHGAPPAAPDRNPGHAHDGSCPYCPLLVSLLAQSLYLPALVSMPARHQQPLARRVAYAAAIRGNLGARGPPVSL